MAKKVDLDLKKAFFELHEKSIETQQKLRISDVQIDALKRVLQHAQLTEGYLNTLEPTTPTYEAVGRCFLLRSFGEINSILVQKQKKASDQIANLEVNKTYLEKSLKETENNCRELVAQKKKTGAI